MSGLILKIKTKSGQILLRELTKNHTVHDLKVQLSQKCKISQNALHVLSGFPPKPISLSNSSLTLDAIGLNTGDALIVEEKPEYIQNKENEYPIPKKEECFAHAYEEQLACPGILMRKVVPADNSCLFTSVGFALSGKYKQREGNFVLKSFLEGKVDTMCGSFMRQIIAEHVSEDTETYSEAILGKSPKAYCEWILKPDSWGGAIELSILSGHYGIEMDVVDTVNAIINRFGEDKNYSHRIFLIFDGIHYDPLYLEPTEGGEIQTTFPMSDDRVFQEAKLLAQQAKSSRQFTDVNKFCLKCLDCQILMRGQLEAQEHAKSSGHINFGEVADSLVVQKV